VQGFVCRSFLVLFCSFRVHFVTVPLCWGLFLGFCGMIKVLVSDAVLLLGPYRIRKVCLPLVCSTGRWVISVFCFAKFWFDLIFLKTDCSRSCLFYSVFFGSLYDFDELECSIIGLFVSEFGGCVTRLFQKALVLTRI
jgi:hypothetical protein